MSTRTVYVAEADEALFARAAAIGGGLSRAIVTALRSYVQTQEAAVDGFAEIAVKVGDGWAGQEKRFLGRRLVRLSLPRQPGRITRYDVFATHRGRIAVHVSDTADWAATAREDTDLWDDPATWDPSWYGPGPRRLDVFDTVEAMAGAVPDDVVDAARQALEQRPVDVLDI